MKSSWNYAKQCWIASLPPNQRILAELLVREIDIINTADIQYTIRKKIQSFIESKPDPREKIVFLPIYDVKDEDKIYINNFPQESISIRPGSEAQVAYWIRNSTQYLQGEYQGKIIDSKTADFPLIFKKLENQEKINFVCITDMAFSGQQVIDFVKALKKTKNHFGNRLGRKISISVISYAISAKAEIRINEEIGKDISSLDFDYYTKSINDIFWISDSKKRGIINLCESVHILISPEKYSNFHSLKKSKKIFPIVSNPKDNSLSFTTLMPDPLGFGNIGNLSITDFFVPNNTPTIFYRNITKTYLKDYYFIFENRYNADPIRNSKDSRRSLDELANLLIKGNEKFNKFQKIDLESRKYEILILTILKDRNNIRVSDLCIFLNISKSTLDKVRIIV